jgi:hypothetical protein
MCFVHPRRHQVNNLYVMEDKEVFTFLIIFILNHD